MKKISVANLLAASFVVSFFSCQQNTANISPTLVSPIDGLILTVENADFTAVPVLKQQGILSDTLLLKVDVPSQNAVVKQLTFANNAITSTVKTGATLTFSNNLSSFQINNSGTSQTYFIKMITPFIPIMYVVKTSDKSAFGSKYFLNKTNPQKIASLNNDEKFEGYVDLTSTNWDNLCIVHSSFEKYFDVNGGWWPQQTYGDFLLENVSAQGNDSTFSSAGPWADWTFTASNPAIISPGYWKVDFDTSSNKLTLLETQWAISGSSTGNLSVPMSYNSSTKQWSTTASLVAGTLNFNTIPVSSGDPVVMYGEMNASKPRNLLAIPGHPIVIKESGSYIITLDLSKAPYYSYEIK